MIASVQGVVAALGPDGAVVEVGGVGLSVSCAPGTLARLRVGEMARLSTSLVVREDSLTLYGFADDDERALFELLQTANGVGPKLAQTILAIHPPREVRRAIASADHAALVKVPGIGRKGAEKIVIELRDRIGPIEGERPARPAAHAGATPGQAWQDQVLHALAGLGFTGREAAIAVDAVAAEFGSAPTEAADPGGSTPGPAESGGSTPGAAESGGSATAAGAPRASGAPPELALVLRRAIQLLGRAR
jgi:Holliday junction DNA helicase RuvA